MNAARARRARLLALTLWTLLLAFVAAWPLAGAGIGPVTTAMALAPLLLPLPGLVSGRRRTLQWSPLTLAPVLALALTELLANARARIVAAVSLALILAAFAAAIGALRTRE